MDYFALRSLAYKLSNGVKIEDRTSFFRTYHKTFLGTDAVAWLIGWLKRNGRPDSKQAALELGNKLLKAGFVSHVSNSQPLKNEKIFYRFNMDKLREEKWPRFSEGDVVAHVQMPQEFGGGIFKYALGDGTTVTNLIEQALDDLHRIRLDISPIGCVSFDVKDCGISLRAIPDDEDVKRDDLLPGAVPVLTSPGVAKNPDNSIMFHLINLTGREPCRVITTTTKDGKKKDLGPPPKDPWEKTVVEDLEEKQQLLSANWATKRAVVVLIRRFG
jgi:hypothetical protein